MMEKIKEFLKSTKTELEKVTWPTREETIASTAITIVVVGLVAVFIGLNDFAYHQLILILFR